MILLINACVRAKSRTLRLASHLISRHIELSGDEIKEVKLSDITFPVVDQDFLSRRDDALARQDFSNPMFDLAKEFAAADTIVIAAPFWDMSFPAALKQYFEQICVTGITFSYTDTGAPKGLCKASKLYYVTTAGGLASTNEYGYGYVRALATDFYGIPETVIITAEGLDIEGADVESILKDAEKRCDLEVKNE